MSMHVSADTCAAELVREGGGEPTSAGTWSAELRALLAVELDEWGDGPRARELARLAEVAEREGRS